MVLLLTIVLLLNLDVPGCMHTTHPGANVLKVFFRRTMYTATTITTITMRRTHPNTAMATAPEVSEPPIDDPI